MQFRRNGSISAGLTTAAGHSAAIFRSSAAKSVVAEIYELKMGAGEGAPHNPIEPKTVHAAPT